MRVCCRRSHHNRRQARSVTGIQTTLTQTLTKVPYATGQVTYKCLHSDTHIYLTMEIPGKFKFNSTNLRWVPAVLTSSSSRALCPQVWKRWEQILFTAIPMNLVSHTGIRTSLKLDGTTLSTMSVDAPLSSLTWYWAPWLLHLQVRLAKVQCLPPRPVGPHAWARHRCLSLSPVFPSLPALPLSCYASIRINSPIAR